MAVDERRRIAHLLRRAGFGATQAELDEYEQLGFDGSVDRLLHPDQIDDADLDQEIKTLGLDNPVVPLALQTEWLVRMMHTRRPLVEKLALFWHGHFATSITKVKSVVLMHKQIELFRTQGLGTFENLVLGVSKDPAMLVWLDNAKSKKEAPNENYGRELMELFTLGVGNYTEDDVKASSRAFTGWSLRIVPGAIVGDVDEADPELTAGNGADDPSGAPEANDAKDAKKQKRMEKRTRDAEFLFRPNWHDDGQKTFLGQTGPWDGSDIVRIIVSQPACATFIARKLFSFFVWDNPDDDVIAPYATTFIDSGGDIRQILSEMFHSDEFSSDQAYRAQVKSPIEFVAATLKLLGASPTGKDTVSTLTAMGQTPLAPPNVGGWTSGLGWIGPSALLDRYNFVNQVLTGPAQRGSQPFDPVDFLGDDQQDAGKIVETAAAILLDGDIDQDQQAALTAYLNTDPSGETKPFDPSAPEAAAKLAGLIRLATTIPAYQLN